MKYEELLKTINLTDQAIHAVYCCGSQVYGTANHQSDNDFVVILSNRKAKQDLIFKDQVDVIVHGIDSFNESLSKHNLFALECLFLPKQFCLKEPRPVFDFKLNREKLIDSVTAKSLADFLKAKNQFEDNLESSKKKLFHSIRLLMFAIQILKYGKINDYTQANHYWTEIQNNDMIDWESYYEWDYPIRTLLMAELLTKPIKKTK